MAKDAKAQVAHWEGCWKDYKHHDCALAKIEDLEVVLAMFKSAVQHVTEIGKTNRSVSASGKWAMVHSDRLADLEIIEEAAKDAVGRNK